MSKSNIPSSKSVKPFKCLEFRLFEFSKSHSYNIRTIMFLILMLKSVKGDVISNAPLNNALNYVPERYDCVDT